MNYHALKLKEVFSQLKSSEEGLSESEAQLRLKKHGKNMIREVKRKTKLGIFLRQFKSLLIVILIIAAVVSGLIGHVLDAVVIGVIVLLNAVIGFFQEYKAEQIIEKLRKSLKYDVLVMRGGKQREIGSKFLVPGDVVILQEGDRVLADCRIFEQDNLQVNEAVLTGESFPVVKVDSGIILKRDVVLAERKNMVFAGTTIVKGKCKALVVGTGMKTEFGKLAELVQTTEDEKTPLEKKMDSFSKKVSIAILGVVAIAFFAGVYLGFDKIEMFLVSVSLAVGAIPEGLPAVVAITLAVAIKKMHKVNTLVRRLPATEALGRATVICTDKTGTLTEEELNVEKIYAGKDYSINSKLDANLKQILKIGVLCNNARDEEDKILGDPTETALIRIAKKFGFDKKKETEENIRIEEYAFDSERKMMTIVRQDGKIKTSYIKGAPEIVLGRCSKEFVNGKIKLLTKKRKEELEKIYMEMAGEGLRVLGFGFRQLAKISQEQAENNLIFSGFQGMIDPPRKEVKQAIKEAMEAGIEIKIITGDSALTAKAVGEKIGLDCEGKVIDGKELDRLNISDWTRVVKEKVIFARVNPEQKLKIVEILKSQKETVAVTGDGVNDILALKRADIGISMGMRGSDVARDSSDIVLLDDNFASIIGAVKEGRTVFDNLKKSIKFLLAANVGEILIVVLALFMKLPLPLMPLALLWLNLVTDSLPALALAVEPSEPDVMKKIRKGGLLEGIWSWIIIAGLLNFAIGIGLFVYALNAYSLEVARTMALSSIVFFELFFVFSCKSDKSLFKTGIFNNKYLIWSVLISAGLHLVALYTGLGGLLHFVPLSLKQLGMCVGAGSLGLVVFEVSKLFKGVVKNRTNRAGLSKKV